MRFWPPYFGAGISVFEFNDDLSKITVQMKKRFWNSNYVGTHFGGSLYAMTDPFYMLMLIKLLGPEYIVWDKAANIQFKKPGTGTVFAHFELSPVQVADIRTRADADPKVEPQFKVQILDVDGQVIAEVDKTLYVKRKDKIKKN